MYASILKFLHSLTHSGSYSLVHSGSLSGSLSHILAHSGPLSGFLRRSLAHKVLARPTTSWLRGHSLSLTIRVLYCAGVGLFCVSHRFRNLASNFALGVLGAVHFVLDRGEGSSRFITLLHRGGLFKVYHNITDLVGIWKGLNNFQYYVSISFYVVLKESILSQI